MYNYIYLLKESDGSCWEIFFPEWAAEDVTAWTSSEDLSMESVKDAVKEWLSLQIAEYLEEGRTLPAQCECALGSVTVGQDDLAKVINMAVV